MVGSLTMPAGFGGTTRSWTCGAVAVAGLFALTLWPSKSHSEVPATPSTGNAAAPQFAAVAQRVGNAGCAATACGTKPLRCRMD